MIFEGYLCVLSGIGEGCNGVGVVCDDGFVVLFWNIIGFIFLEDFFQF